MSSRMKALAVLSLVLLSSCARQEWHAPLSLPADSSGQPALPPGKYKFTGPVTFTVQHGNGNVATPTTADNRKAGQRGGAVATGPAAQADATTKNTGTPWWVYLGLVAVGAGLYAWLRGKFAWLPP